MIRQSEAQAGRPAPRARREPEREAVVGRLARAYAFVIVALRYLVLLGWLAAVVLDVPYLTSLSASGGVGDLVPSGSHALRAEADAIRLFRVPLSAPVAVLHHSPRRLPLVVQEKAARSAIAVHRGVARIPGLAGALPVSNAAGVFPGSRQRSTTIITFLYFRPSTSMAAQTSGGELYARRYAGAPRDHLAGVTGPVPARYEQGQIIQRYLPWVEAATLLAIFLIVGWHF